MMGLSADDGAPMKLIDQKCWFKITHIFGVIGPEIMFFCQEKSMISNIQMPDLDPITVCIRQFNQHGHEINVQLNDTHNIQGNNPDQFASQTCGLQILLSQFITLKQFTNYAMLNLSLIHI